MEDKKLVMNLEDVIRLFELLTLFQKEDDYKKIQGVIQDIITSLKTVELKIPINFINFRD